ncbi:Alpha-1A adrenergic receptor [Armadillidium vulgare]|nr:Alpha-1A adrenergic receptor [Armadillidium vulgare]
MLRLLDCQVISFDSLQIFKSIVLGIIVCLTICGNVLVLLAVIISRNLRSSTYYLIVNLAVADLLLGTTVLPFSAVLEVSNIWYFGQLFCEIWAAVDVLCCTASIWSLCVISLDRYIGVTRPLAYSTIMTEKRVFVLIGAVWALSIAISIGPVLGWKTPPSSDPRVCSVNEELGYVLFSVIGSFYLPGLCIVIVYWRIYKEAYRQSKFLESGVKTTSCEITLRVHKGGNSSRRSSSPRMTLRAHRGGVGRSSSPAPSETSLTLNGTILSHRSDVHSESLSPSPDMLQLHKGRSSLTSTKSNFLFPISPNEPWTHLHPEDAISITNRKLSSDSQISSPERRISGIHGRLVKFRRQKKAAKTLGIVFAPERHFPILEGELSRFLPRFHLMDGTAPSSKSITLSLCYKSGLLLHFVGNYVTTEGASCIP